ncbi:MAG: dTDP-glucose 4,6-dehydratase [Succinivibrio sp.]|nr:dTDP-glucose 4,6-dehydratase [Succinivibrio sp.]
MKSILITGAVGFIGSNFVHYLLQNDHRSDLQVVALDALSYAGRLDNLKGLEGEGRFTFIKGDILDAALLSKLLVRHSIDCVVNFAAHTHVDRSISNPTPFTLNNVLGTQTLLEAARRYWEEPNYVVGTEPCRFIQISTDEVYGALGPEDPPFTESTPLYPSSPYSASKAAADLTALAYHKTFGMPVIITRCSNNYGPRQYPEKLIPLMISKALRDEPLPVYGDGLQVRDWLQVEDHCAAIIAAINRGRLGEVYNIGGHNEHSNLYIVNLILNALHKSPDLIDHVTDRPAHDRRYAINPDKTRSELSWEPKHDFESGLRSTIYWYLNNPSWLVPGADHHY